MDKLEKAIKAWECCHPFNRQCDKCPYDADCFHDSFDRVAIADMVKLLKEQQAEINKLNGFINGFSKDAVPVVRYKDCRNSKATKRIEGKYRHCPILCADVDEDFYCGFGKAKDGDGE